MMALAMAALGVLLLAYSYASSVPQQIAKAAQLQADVSASNGLSYRQAVITYLNAHSGISGTIVDSSLSFQTGYIRDVRWTNQVASGVLYVFSVTPPPPGTLKTIYKATLNTPMVGVVVSSGIARGPSGITLSVPAVIANNNIVFVGI